MQLRADILKYEETIGQLRLEVMNAGFTKSELVRYEQANAQLRSEVMALEKTISDLRMDLNSALSVSSSSATRGQGQEHLIAQLRSDILAK